MAQRPLTTMEDFITRYWLDHYVGSDGCTLCGNSGIIDTSGVKTAVGIPVGRVDYCLCPNGRVLRNLKAPLDRRRSMVVLSR